MRTLIGKIWLRKWNRWCKTCLVARRLAPIYNQFFKSMLWNSGSWNCWTCRRFVHINNNIKSSKCYSYSTGPKRKIIQHSRYIMSYFSLQCNLKNYLKSHFQSIKTHASNFGLQRIGWFCRREVDSWKYNLGPWNYSFRQSKKGWNDNAIGHR